MNKSFYISMKALWSYQRNPSSSPPQYKWAKMWLTLSFLGIFLMPPVQAQTGAALDFDGADDYATAPAGVYFNGNLTIEAWVYPKSYAFWSRIIDFGNGAGVDNVFLALSYEGTGKPNFNIGGVDLLSTQTLTLNQWNHVAATLNGTTATMYINGIAVGTATLPIPANVVRNNCYIGKSNWPDAYANVVMDEVRIWSRALPQCEVQSTMNCELGSGQTGLTAYYKFNQGTAAANNAGVTSLTDASGNNRNATLNNFGLTGTTSNWVSTGGVTTGTTCIVPSVSIAGSPSTTITYGTSVTFAATGANGGTSPIYQWKKNGTNVGTNSTTYTDATLTNGDVITCVLANTCGVTATSNSLTMTVIAPAGAALNFDGVDDYVSTNYDLNRTELTLEAWVYPQSSARMYVISNDLPGQNGAGFGVNNNLLEIDVHNQFINLTTPTIPNNQWSHVAVVYNPDGKIRAYVNGTEVYNTTVSGWTTSLNGSSSFLIGRHNQSETYQFNGKIDEVRVWSRSLPQCEIQNNRGCELGATQTGLAAYYKFNQGITATNNAGVTSLTDASGNNLTGTLTNFSLTGTTSNWVNTGGVTTGTTCSPLPTPSVVIATSSQTTCVGSSVTFTATPTNGGTTPTYQWKKNGTNIVGAMSATYVSTTLANSDVISCVLTSNAVCAITTTATSNSLTMTVNPTTTSVSIAATATSITGGTSVTFTATPIGGGTAPFFQWKKNNLNTGTNSSTYTDAALLNGDVISCVMTSNNSCVSSPIATSNSIPMTVTGASPATALDFDGTNDYVQFSNTGMTASGGTVEFWFKNDVATSNRTFIDLGGEKFSVFLWDDGKMYFRVGGTQFSTNYRQTGIWTHIALVWNGVGQPFYGYINGVQIGTGTQGNSAITGNFARLGQTTLSYSYYYDGKMDEARIWSRALPQCEIKNNLNGELGSGQTGLLAYYKFNQGSVNTNNAGITTLTDASGNNRNGTLTNFGLTGTSSNWVSGGGVAVGTTAAAYITPSVSVNSATACINTPATLTATLAGFAATANYQWETSTNNTTWSAIAGATAAAYSPSTSTAGTRYFRLKAFDACGVAYSTGTAFTVTSPGLTVTADASQVCQNTVATLTATTTTGPPQYQWQSSTDGNTWTNVSGATATTFAPPTSIVGLTYYRAVATYSSGCIVNSETKALIVNALPSVVVTGGNVTVCLNSSNTKLNAVLSNTTGAPVSQWQSSADGITGWTDIVNSNVLNYTPPTTVVGTVYYRLKVTYAATSGLCNATIYSNVRKVAVLTAPSVTTTADNTYCAGTNVTLTSTCSDAAATPTWVGPNNFVASTANITVSNISSAQTGSYKVIYLTETGCVGEKTTSIKLAAELEAAVTKTVSASTIVAGNSVQITVKPIYKQGLLGKIDYGNDKVLTSNSLVVGSQPIYAANDDSPSQQWLLIPVSGNTLDLSSSQRYYIKSIYSGLYLRGNATSPVVEMATFDNSTYFQWYKGDHNMTNEQGRNVTIGVGLVVNIPFYLDKNARLGSSFAVQDKYASITERPLNMTLSWNDGITTATRSVSPTTTINYIATFTSSAGCTIKDTTTITVLPTPTVSVTASATRVCLSQAATLTATVTNNVNNATYQWQSSANNTAWTNIEGETNNTYSAPTTKTGSVYYRAIVTNILGTFTANGVQITVEAPPSVSISASQTVVCPNGATTLTATYSSGYGTPTVQWQSSDDGNAWTNIAGATSDTYQPVTANNGKKYYRYSVGLPTACLPTFQSQSVAITVNSELTVDISGVATQTVCKGTYRVFTLTTNGAEAKYTWESSTNGTTWTPIANETTANYVAPTTTTGTMYYRGTVVSGCSGVSAVRQVTVTEVPTLTVGSPISATCLERSISFSASLSSTSAGTPSYVWQTSTDNLNWVTQVGASGNSYTAVATAIGNTYVRAGLKFASCVDSTFSTPKPFSVRPNPNVAIVPTNPSAVLPFGDIAICANTTTVLKSVITGGAGKASYQWQKYRGEGWFTFWDDIPNATDSTFTIVPGQNAFATYKVKATYSNCPDAISSYVNINPIKEPIVSVQAPSSVCQGSQVDMSSGISSGARIQWQSSPDGTTWTNIANATSTYYSYVANTVGTTLYRSVVSYSSCNPVASSAVPISVISSAVPTLALSSNNTTLCGDAEVTITANVTNLNGATPQYEWKRNGQLYVGQNLSFITKTTADGLGSNSINDVAIAGNKIYVATNNGLSISTDGGTTFINKTTANGLPNNNITAIGMHPDGIRLIVGTQRGAAISRDGGNSFVELTRQGLFSLSYNPFSVPIYGIGVSPDGKTAFISTNFETSVIINFQHDFGESNHTTAAGGSFPATTIKFKDNNTAYFGSSVFPGFEVAKKNNSGFSFSSSPLSAYRYLSPFTFKGDTIFVKHLREFGSTRFQYFINDNGYNTTGIPAILYYFDADRITTLVNDFYVNDNVVYATSPNIYGANTNGGLYLSKDGGKSFSDITGTTPGIGTDNLDRIFMGNGRMYITSGAGLKVSASNTPSITFTTNKSDKIECIMRTTGVCSNTTSQSVTLNYIGDVDPLSIKVAVDGTTGTGTWTAVNNATGYGWELSKFSPDRSSKTFVKNGTVTTNSVTLTDLNPSSNYELTVKTVCNITQAFARLVDATGTGAGGSTSFTTGFIVPQAIRDSLAKASNLCAEDELVLGPGFPDGYEVNIYSGTDKTYIDYASNAHRFKVKLTANTKYYYKVFKSDTKIYTFTSSNNDAGSESKRYTVPTGVSKVTFKIAGSKGGGSYGGKGGITTGSVTPTVGTTYYLFPGTTTTADAGKSRGTATSTNGGGGSYVSTTSLRTGAILVAGGGGGGIVPDLVGLNFAGAGGLTGGDGYVGGAIITTGGNATRGGISMPSTSDAGPYAIAAKKRTESGFMQGSSTNNVIFSLLKGDYGGGGGYYGGGSFLSMDIKKYSGGGGSSYANTTVVKDVLYETGTNNGTGYVTVYEYSQATANSDFLPLDIVLSPVPVLANAMITLNPTNPAYNTNFQGTFSLTGNVGFATSYRWNHSSVNSNIVTLNRNSSTGLIGYADVKYCSNRQKTIGNYINVIFSSAIPPDSSSNRSNRLLTPTVSIASSTTNICAGEQVIFTATTTDVVDENLFYRWYKNGEIIFDEPNNVFQTSSLANGDIITCTLFYPSATTGTDSIASTNSVTMTVATPATPKVTIASSANNVCPGTAITFTPTPTSGGTSPQYKWYLNGDLVQTSPTYTSSSFENSDYVECIMASNAACLAQTESEISASVSVNLKQTVTPTATVYVSDTLICAGSSTSLSVRTENAGSTPQYQWRHNGAPVGTDRIYYPVSMSHNDAIWCEVTPSADACANTSFVQSNTELIQTAEVGASFTPLATITVDKDSICTGDSLTFSVEGNYLGNAPSFVWKKNGTTLDGTEALITLKTIANGDLITCVATSSLGCVSAAEATSNALTAKVVEPAAPIVSISTPNTTICPNIPVVITATPTYGGSFPVYNWRLNGNAHNALPHEFFNYTTENGLGHDYTNAVFVRNDTVFSATRGGVSYRVKGDSIYSLSYDKGLATSNVQAIYVDDSGIYAGTDGGLSISTDGLNSFRPINTTETGLSSSNITAITAIGSTLFVGTDNGLNISIDGGNTFSTKKMTNGLASNRIRHLFVDGTTLYVSTEGGLNISTNNGTTFITKTIADSLNSDTVLGVWAKGAAIYAATQQGLAVSNNGGTTFTKLTMDNGLPNRQVNSVWVVADSMVYAATSGGLGISKNGGKTFRGFYETDTLGSNTILGVTVAGGRIYAATTGGLSISDPSKIRVYPNDGDVFATNLTSNKSCVATSMATSNNLTFYVGSVSAASLATTSVMNTSAGLTWTGTVGSYNWVVVPTGEGINGTVIASGTTSTLPITVTGLSTMTTYDLFVQGACTPTGTVDWVGPLTFTTKDNAFVNVKTILQGAYNTTSGLMNENLRTLNLIPTTEPYTGMTGFTHVNGGGGEKTTSTVLAVTGNDAIVDWVFVELRDKTTPATVIATRSALIQRDGDVVDVDGVSPVGFSVAADDYYVVVRHRNHLGIRTASTISLNKVSATPYDFTTAANQALNSIQKDLTGGKFGMYAGNVNSNNTVRASGSLTVNDYLKLINLLGTSSSIQTNVYSAGDVNMDGTMRASGSLLVNDYLKIINAIGNSSAIITQPF